jgi:hypothetical protein
MNAFIVGNDHYLYSLCQFAMRYHPCIFRVSIRLAGRNVRSRSRIFMWVILKIDNNCRGYVALKRMYGYGYVTNQNEEEGNNHSISEILVWKTGLNHEISSVGVHIPSGTQNSELTPWSRVLLDKSPVSQLLKNLPTFYGTRRFSTMFTRVLHWSLSWARWIQSISLHPFYYLPIYV